MKLTNATEQALAVIAIIATQKRDVPVSSASIYQKLAVSPSYVQKLLRKLVVANLINATPGNNGGFSLAKKLTEISLLEIVEAIEGRVETFPGIGVLKRAFAEFDTYAQNGHTVISTYFHQADDSWRAELSSVTVYHVLSQVFGSAVPIPEVDWN